MSNAIDSYTDLISAVQEACEDVGSELLDYLPTAINNAELRLTREIDNYGLIQTSTITVASATPTFSKPSGHRLTRSVHYTDPTTGRSKTLRRKTDDYLLEYWPQEVSVGTPKYYAEDDNTTFRIAPCTSATASVKVIYEARPAALTSANPTNYFTDFTADALFHATMMEAAAWQRNADLFNYHQGFYDKAIMTINQEGLRQKRDDGTPINNPEGGQNTLLDAGRNTVQ